LKRRQLLKSRILTLSFWSPPLWVLLESTPTISICLSSVLCFVFQWIESTSISICLSFLLCLVLQWIESTPNSSGFIVSEPPPPPNYRTLSTSIGFTACPLSFLSRLRVLYLCWAVFTPIPSCVGCVSTTSPRADTVSTASPPADCTSTTPGSLEHLRSLEYRANLEQRVYHPSSYRLLHLLPSVCRLLVRVDYLSSRRLLLISTSFGNTVCYWTYLRWVRVMDRGYLGDVGRRTVMRFGTVDAKRPAVAIWAMHPRSLDSSWRG